MLRSCWPMSHGWPVSLLWCIPLSHDTLTCDDSWHLLTDVKIENTNWQIPVQRITVFTLPVIIMLQSWSSFAIYRQKFVSSPYKNQIHPIWRCQLHMSLCQLSTDWKKIASHLNQSMFHGQPPLFSLSPTTTTNINKQCFVCHRCLACLLVIVVHFIKNSSFFPFFCSHLAWIELCYCVCIKSAG